MEPKRQSRAPRKKKSKRILALNARRSKISKSKPSPESQLRRSPSPPLPHHHTTSRVLDESNTAVVPAPVPIPARPVESGDVFEFQETHASPVRPLRQSSSGSTASLSPSEPLTGRRLISIREFISQIQNDVHGNGLGCSFLDSVFVKEHRIGFASLITYKCKMCNVKTVLRSDPTADDDVDVNNAIVTGALAGGGGYATLSHIAASANMPCMGHQMYIDREQGLTDRVEDAAYQSMIDAGKEEKRLAIREGLVGPDGIPLVTVITDGMWGKRSYKNKYDALSGTASIVGWRTKKVLFCGVRNKYCTICALAKKKGEAASPHFCYRNWDGPSTSMEGDIIAEGFSKSMEMHGVKYHQLIGITDGDSSVYKRILQSMPYGASLVVEKIECKKHLLRNFRGSLKEIAGSNSKSCPRDKRQEFLTLRDIIGKRLVRLAGGISQASLYRQTEKKPTMERIKNLRSDVLNTANHVFGDHSRCAKYFCDGQQKEENLVPRLLAAGLWTELMRFVNRIADRSASLIYNVSNNMCEVANSVTAKFLNGKRLFYSGRSSFNLRCSAAVISLNTSGRLCSTVYNVLNSTGSNSAGTYLKRFEDAQERKLHRNRKRRMETGPVRRKPKDAVGRDRHYGNVDGDDEMEVDPPPPLWPMEELQAKMDKYYEENIKVTPQDRANLREASQGTHVWMEARRKRLTASKFGAVCRQRPTTSCKKRVYDCLYADVQTTSMRHGQATEEVARERLRSVHGVSIETCGLWVDKERPYLAASPDGIVDENTILEIKCPLSAERYESALAAIDDGKVPYLESKEGQITLKKNSHYFYQIQGQLHITRRTTCVFYVYTSKWDQLMYIQRNDNFWNDEMQGQLERFYWRAMLPELVELRYSIRGNTDDIREADYVTTAQNQKTTVKRKRVK